MTVPTSSRPASWPQVKAPGAPTVMLRRGVPREHGDRSAVEPAPVADAGAEASPWTRPFLIVLGYLFIDYGRPQDWLSPLQMLRPGLLIQGAGIIALLYHRPIHLTSTAKYIVAFLGVMAVMVPFATNNAFALSFTRDFAVFLIGAVIPIMTFVKTSRQTAILFRFWIAINAALAFYGITHGGRGVGSFLGDENDFCLAVNVALPVPLFMLSATKSNGQRLALLGSVGLSLAAVVASMSRGGFIGLVTVGVVAWWRSPRKATTGVVVLLTVATLSLTVSDDYWKEMQTIKTADQEGDTGDTRRYSWELAGGCFLIIPSLAWVRRISSTTSFKYEDPDRAARGFHVWGMAAHSLYFTLLPEEGLVGAFIFIAVAVSGWRLRRGVGIRYRALSRTDPDLITPPLTELYVLCRAVDVSLLAYLVTGAFISVLYYPHFWLVAAFSVVLRRTFDLEMQTLVASGSAEATNRRTVSFVAPRRS